MTMEGGRRLILRLLVISTALATCVLGQQGFGGGNQYDSDRWPGNKDKPWCDPNSPWPCYEPPFWPYDQIVRRIGDIGEVIGRSMVFFPNRYINIFLGVPYARPPIRELRFKVRSIGRPSGGL